MKKTPLSKTDIIALEATLHPSVSLSPYMLDCVTKTFAMQSLLGHFPEEMQSEKQRTQGE